VTPVNAPLGWDHPIIRLPVTPRVPQVRASLPPAVADDEFGGVIRRQTAAMGTAVTIDVVGPASGPDARPATEASLDRAMAWFTRVEACCNRFDPESELRQLTAAVGVSTPVSTLLFEAVHFALVMAEETGGAFDPTVGVAMEAQGFNRDYRSGEITGAAVARPEAVSYHDVALDREHRTITLRRPLVLDLGSVAKGLAVDLAAAELRPLEHFAIDAGGDLYVGGHRPDGRPWSIGIRDPRQPGQLIATVPLSNEAMCTSGDYERRSPVDPDEHHILDPRTGRSAPSLASATVVAPTALLADALATAAFVLGPQDGLTLLTRHGVEGLLVTPTLDRLCTPGFPR
jgi:thiamine biosynthesis lipoprotein